MNYRHAFHAGNFADVLKHAILALALKLLTGKPKPLRVIDTHAGTGSYRLDAEQARRTGEWHTGIGRLLGPSAAPLPAEMAALLAPYLDAVRCANPPGRLDVYPGSPALALALLRPTDRLIASELHPEDAASLRQCLRGDPRAKVLALDGWQALRALLPPKERRGLILIDPPFEEPGELERLADGLAEGVRRFATGTYLLWLPVKEPRQVASFRAALERLGLKRLHWVELHTETIATADRLAATALVILNPPFGLEKQLAELLPFLAERLATGPGSGWQLGPVTA
jgi:23S rRNA (adenine2030-N6)-methyltransferase